MKDSQISVIDAAAKLRVRKQAVFKLIKRLGIKTSRERSSSHKGQTIVYITNEDLDLISAERTAHANARDTGHPLPVQERHGVFYLIALEPNHDPGRFKVGFASSISERLRKHRCSAPFAVVLATWPCHELWEKTAIDCVTQGCVKLHTEVFRTEDIADVKAKCDQFFSLMPDPDSEREISEHSPLQKK